MDMNTITYDEYLYEVDNILLTETGYPTANDMLDDVHTGFQHGMTPGQCVRALLERGCARPLHNTVLHGDCIDRMTRMPAASADLILTDPPYLVNYRSRDGRRVANDNDPSWLNPAFGQMHRVLKNNSFCICFYGWQATGLFLDAAQRAGFRVAGHMVFVKRYASSKRYLAHHHEQAFLFAKGRPERSLAPISDVLDWAYTGNKLHPTQKPVEPLARIIRTFTTPGDLVLDPFCGSGSTLAAAQQCNRRWLGIELDAAHCVTARKRLEGTAVKAA